MRNFIHFMNRSFLWLFKFKKALIQVTVFADRVFLKTKTARLQKPWIGLDLNEKIKNLGRLLRLLGFITHYMFY